jgi:type II secretory pathway pseudopilin PulG
MPNPSRIRVRLFGSSPSKTAFTLIEILIVLAMTLVLTVILVSNGRQARVKSDVARVQADFRVLAAAIEAYYVDHEGYIYDQDDDLLSRFEDGFRLLTTPVAYLRPGASLVDPFQGLQGSGIVAYQLASGVDPYRRSPDRIPRGDPDYEPVQAWCLFSNGPAFTGSSDPSNGGGTQAVMANDDWPFRPIGVEGPGQAHLRGVRAFYDPTNGVISFGGIFRFGGDYNGGNWTIEDIDHNLWEVQRTYP